MARLTDKILEHADRLPEGTPVTPKSLLHLGNRAAIYKALSRLTARGELIRASHGIYLRPITSRFGTGGPSAYLVVEALARHLGEVIVAQEAAAANKLGLTYQAPMRLIYITSGRSRTLRLGKLVVEIRHKPRWRLALAHKPAGTVMRALVWAGPEEVDATLKKLKPKLSQDILSDLVAVAPQLPTWLARSIGKVAHG